MRKNILIKGVLAKDGAKGPFWVIDCGDDGSATVWAKPIADELFTNWMGMGKRVCVEWKTTGEYTNIRAIHGPADDDAPTMTEPMAIPSPGNAIPAEIPKAEESPQMYSQKDCSIIAQCLTKVVYGNTTLTDSDDNKRYVLETYRYFFEELSK